MTAHRAMTVPYDRQTLDTPNPIARFAHRARFARSLAFIGGLPPGAAILDYGCGEGRFLSSIERRWPGKYRLMGYEPFMSRAFDGYSIVSGADDVADESLHAMTCLEVCEHLDGDEVSELARFARLKLRRDGMLVVSVPIMTGPVLALKEMNRCLLHRRVPEHSLGELFGSVFLGLRPSRASNIKTSHKGYDYRETLVRLSGEFGLLRLDYSPFRPLPSLLNSQVFMVFHPKATDARPRG